MSKFLIWIIKVFIIFPDLNYRAVFNGGRMLLKVKDSKEEDLIALQRLLSLKGISHKQRFFMEREIRNIKKGDKGEKDAAYYIDFYYANSKNWVVIHDLRLEYQGQVAQIDHLLINRMFHIYVLESKNFGFSQLKINEFGEFEVKYGQYYFGIPSPVEQNQRHIDLLTKIINDNRLMPRRIGLPRMPVFFNYILVSPQTKIVRPKNKEYQYENVIKADMLKKVIDKNIDKVSAIEIVKSLYNLCSLEVVCGFGKKLIALHKPRKIDWNKKFGINVGKEKKKIVKYYCFKCGKSISEKVAKFCWNNKDKFRGKAYCYDCQRLLKS